VTVAAGAGGIGGGGQGGPLGCAADGTVGTAMLIDPGGTTQLYSGVARNLELSAVVREQGTATLEIQGVPGDNMLLLVNFAQDPSWAPGIGALLPAPAALDMIPIGLMPGSGSVTLSSTVPELGPGIDALWIYVQAAMFSVADGWVLTSASGSVFLDESL
jgi:hypothetical protein